MTYAYPNFYQEKFLELLNPLRSALLRCYPAAEGWKLFNRYTWSSKVYDYVLQKETEGGSDRILVEMYFGDQVTESDLNNLRSLVNRLESGTIRLVKTILVVLHPVKNAAQLMEIIPGIEVYTMEEFAALSNNPNLQPDKSKLVA